MTISEEELAALGRFMGGTVTHAVVHELDGYWFNEELTGCASWLPPEYLAADVLTKLVKDGAEPSVYADAGMVTVWGVSGAPTSRAESWPLAVLKAAIAYQLVKESK